MNRLSKEKSLYLKQHVDNPVHWRPFGPEALEESKSKNLPIFLSIGYSSCHWCHVMAHESFEDLETAKQLNQDFICIKVDREEYPDLDQYYQEVCQLFGRPGGWPLSVFLTPELGPYFVGTYFPKVGRQGMLSFTEVLQHMKKAFQDNRNEIDKQTLQIQETLKEGPKLKERIQLPGNFPHPQVIFSAIDNHLDKNNGGFGGAPKFPHFAFFEWAIEQGLERHLEKEPLNFAIDTLKNILMGGIYDQVRGGIHRYSTDETWLVPHFEKMLYDQAGLIKVLSKLALIDDGAMDEGLIFHALFDTLTYLEKEMMSESSIFFSAQDADSEGEEGIFFTFTEEEFEQAITKENEALKSKMSELKKWFNISSSGNFEHGLNMVSLNKEYSQDFFQKENWEMICQVRKALLKERQNRIPPLTDTKAQASWNFHLLSSLADVAQFVPWPEIREKALNLLKTSWTKCLEQFVDLKNFHISHVSTLDKTPHYFEDNQNFLEATLRYYEITGDQSCREILLPWWNHISENFILENKIYTRNISDKNQPYPNLPQKYFDHSYRSPASSFIGNSLRLAVLLAENHIQERVLPLIDECTQMCLANPLSSGESLRYLTYPRDIFKKIEVPQSFLQDDQFLRLRAHLPQRFVLDYHQRDQDSWQICSLSTCEKQGKGVRELFEKLSGSNQQNLNPNMKNENNFTKAQDKGEK